MRLMVVGMTLRHGFFIASLFPLALGACGGTSKNSGPSHGTTGGTGGSGGGKGGTGGGNAAGAPPQGGMFSAGRSGVGGMGKGGGPSGGNGGQAASSGVGGTVGGAGQGGAGQGGAEQGGSSGAGEAGVGAEGGEGGGPAVECPTACEPQAQGACGNNGVTWVCFGAGEPPDFEAGGCTDLATQVPRFCCPPTFLPECQ
jgi:hypothetical protein